MLSGDTSLDSAYETAQRNKREEATKSDRIASLRERYPDLADKVVEGDLLKAAFVVSPSGDPAPQPKPARSGRPARAAGRSETDDVTRRFGLSP